MNELDVSSPDVINFMIEKFGDEYLESAVRVLSTNQLLPKDANMVTEALNLVLLMYNQRVKDNLINQDKAFH